MLEEYGRQTMSHIRLFKSYVETCYHLFVQLTTGSDINFLYQHQTPDEMLQFLVKEKQWFVYIEELLMRMKSFMHGNIADIYRDSLKSSSHILQYWNTSLSPHNLKKVGKLLELLFRINIGCIK